MKEYIFDARITVWADDEDDAIKKLDKETTFPITSIGIYENDELIDDNYIEVGVTEPVIGYEEKLAEDRERALEEQLSQPEKPWVPMMRTDEHLAKLLEL